MKKVIIVLIICLMMGVAVFAEEEDTHFEISDIIDELQKINENLEVIIENTEIAEEEEDIQEKIYESLIMITGNEDEKEEGILKEGVADIVRALGNVDNLEEKIALLERMDGWLEHLNAGLYALVIIVLPLTIIVGGGYWVLKQFF